jgi:hypothetical protein
MPINNGGHAFPLRGFSDGMSLRDYFAAAALQGQIANVGITSGIGEEAEKKAENPLLAMAELAYRHADAMLEARELKEEESDV